MHLGKGHEAQTREAHEAQEEGGDRANVYVRVNPDINICPVLDMRAQNHDTGGGW